MALPPLRSTAHDIGLALLAPAVLALTGLAVALATGEWFAAFGFGVTAAAGGGVGSALAFGLREHRTESALLGRSDSAKPAVALAWLLSSVVAAVPFVAAALAGADATHPAASAFRDPVNALFESMSGLTSTGLSVAPDASRLPHSLQWWRSLLQWVGGVGILYAVLALAEDQSCRAHGQELEEEIDTPTTKSYLLAVWGIYAGYTIGSILAFRAVGMPAWAAVNHGMTAIATGGFTITGDSFVSYGRGVHFVATVVILLGAVSFSVHYAALVRGRPGYFVRERQNQLMAGLLAVGAGVLALATASEVPLADAAFQWTSALLTAGFYTTELAPWSTAALLLLVVAMFVGGAAGSTAGGLKQQRVLQLLRGLAQPSERARAALYQLGRLAAALALGTALLVLLSGVAWMDALFEAASALGTVGLSVGVSSPDLPAGGRLVLIALMWAGRLEVAAALALFVPHYSDDAS